MKRGISGAASAQKWHGIDWLKSAHKVTYLQQCILVAYKEDNQSEVVRLQNDLVRSFAARALAVKRVTTNAGKKTPGLDDILWDTPEIKYENISLLTVKPDEYRAKPVRRVWISKDGRPLQSDKSNWRPLGIPTMFDRAMQALWTLALLPISEEVADQHSYGFRPYRSALDALQMVFLRFSPGHRPLWVLEGDIEKCYDKISHEWILQNIPMEKQILNQWLKAGVYDRGQTIDNEAGVPQGGIISPLIANMTLDGMQELVRNAVAPYTARAKRTDGRYPTKVTFIRYADDFVVSGVNRQLLEEVVKPAIEKFLEIRGLKLSPKKNHPN